MTICNRRSFIGQATKSTVGLTTAVIATQARPVLGANDKVLMALIGCGGRGTSLVRGFARRDDVKVTYLCDLNKNRGNDLFDMLKSQHNEGLKKVNHYQHVFDANDVDAVIVATPDHWHGPATIFACQAGKDVYVEKPPSHNVWEGRKMVEAAQRYKRVVQVGTQNRSAPYVLEALKYIQEGGLGKIPLCKVYNLKSGGEYHLPPNGEPPEGFDWNTWLGPAPERPYNSSIVHGGWHKFWAYSGGDMADDGVHQLDIARMLIGKAYPRGVHASGGKLAFDDDREAPDTQTVTYDFDDTVMTFELTQYAPYMFKTPSSIRSSDEFPYWPQNSTRIELYGTKRQMIIGRHGGGWQVLTSDHKVVEEMPGRIPEYEHKQNFIDCIRSRKQPNADIEEGHRSACLVHLGNIALRVGSKKLWFDSDTERFAHDEEANQLIKRDYREPFVVPEKV